MTIFFITRNRYRFPSAGFIRNILLLFVAMPLLLSCDEHVDPEVQKKNFTSIFDHKEFSATFYPVDLKQTPDGGYLILAGRKIPESNFRGIYVLKADEMGRFVRALVLEDHYVNPVGDVMPGTDGYYFFGMDALSLEAQLINVDAGAESVVVTPIGGISYPAAATRDENGFLLLSYNHENKTSVVSLHNAAGQVIKGPKGFSIGAGDEVAEPVINHFLRTGKQFPFQVGKVTEGLYFFNGFLNYTFSLVFTNLNDDEPTGVVQGQQDDGGFSAVLPLGGDQYAAARFNFGENYFLPRTALKTNGPTAGAYLGGYVLAELVPDAAVKILRATSGTRKLLIFASNTRSKQIGLFFYDESTGAFISSKHLGFSNPFEVASLIQTEDGGLAVCGTTWLAGRFPRICLFKISADEIATVIE